LFRFTTGVSVMTLSFRKRGSDSEEHEVSKATLDIICLTAFGYVADSLHTPNNELAEAYHDLLNLQSGEESCLISFINVSLSLLVLVGENAARVIALISIPGAAALLRSEWMYNHRHLFKRIPQLAPIEVFVNSIRRIKAISAKIIEERTKDVMAIAAADSQLEGKKDILSLLVQSRMMDRTDGASAGSKAIMSDEMMIQHVVCYSLCYPLTQRF
jgi:hypothetical protein